MKIAIRTGILFSVIILSFSCSQEDLSLSDTEVDVLVKDKSGNNLLSNTTAGYYKMEEIKMFYFENGSKTPAASNRFQLVKGENNEPLIRITPMETITNGETTTTTYIQWRANDEDMIESTVTRTKHSNHCNKVKHNGHMKYDSHTSKGRRVIEIVK